MDNKVGVEITLEKAEKFKSDVNNAMGSLNKASLSSLPIIKGVKNDFTKAFNLIKTSAIAAGTAVAGAFVGMVGNGIRVASELETARQGFITLLGDAKKADEIIATIKKDAAKTPFEINGLVQANQLLTSVTKDGKRSERMLMNVGKALAAMGRGQPELDRIIINLQQIGAVGKASMLDIKQFAFAGIPIFAMLKKELNLTGGELEDLIKNGGVSFEILERMFQKAGEGSGQFSKAFTNASGTFQQRLSNLKDAWNVFTADFVTKSGAFDLAKTAIAFLTDNMDLLTPAIKKVKEWIEKLQNPTKEQKEQFEKIKKKVFEVVDSITGKNGLIASVSSMIKSFTGGETGSNNIEDALNGVKVAISTLTVYLDIQIAKWAIYLDILTTVLALLGNTDAIAAKSIGITKEQQETAKKSDKMVKDLISGKTTKVAPTITPKTKNKTKTTTPVVIPKGTLIPKPGQLFGGFANGGIIPGKSMYGDKVMARVNSGEMILNKGQQSALFNMLKNMSSGNQINFNGGVNFTSSSSPMQQQNNFVNMLMQLQ